LLGPSGRWEVIRYRPLPGVEFLVVLNAGMNDPLAEGIRRGHNPLVPTLELLRQLAPAGARVLDLGGHVGLFSLTAAALGYEVLTVEASLQNASLLGASARLNGFAHVHVVHCAIGAGSGLVPFCDGGPYGSISTSRVRRPVTAQVPVLSGDDILAGMGWNRVAFVKMDVEGSEVAAVAGLRSLLGQAPAPAVVSESNEHTLNFFGHTTQTLQQAFTGLGYQCYQIGPRLLTPTSADDLQGCHCVDYLGVQGPLPPLPPGWQATAPFSQGDIAEQLGREFTDANPDVRASVARRLSQADAGLLVLPGFHAGMQRLLHDDNAQVRQAAAWYPRRDAA
jgi:FkbM family methyltransferase